MNELFILQNLVIGSTTYFWLEDWDRLKAGKAVFQCIQPAHLCCSSLSLLPFAPPGLTDLSLSCRSQTHLGLGLYSTEQLFSTVQLYTTLQLYTVHLKPAPGAEVTPTGGGRERQAAIVFVADILGLINVLLISYTMKNMMSMFLLISYI